MWRVRGDFCRVGFRNNPLARKPRISGRRNRQVVCAWFAPLAEPPCLSPRVYSGAACVFIPQSRRDVHLPQQKGGASVPF